MALEYSSPFGGETTSVEYESGGWDMTVTGTGSTAVGSPLEARIEASNWSREDIELAIRLLTAAATIAALYATYKGGR